MRNYVTSGSGMAGLDCMRESDLTIMKQSISAHLTLSVWSAFHYEATGDDAYDTYWNIHRPWNEKKALCNSLFHMFWWRGGTICKRKYRVVLKKVLHKR